MKKIIILVLILVVIGLGFYLFTDNTNNVEDQPETVSLFYYNPELDMDEGGNILCSEEGLVSVEREIENSEDVIHNTIALLIQGDLTEEEVNQGIETEFPLENFSLVSSELEEGVLTLTFDDPDFSSSGGSCRSSILLNQILSTADQFSEVEEVRIMPEEIFQP